MNDRLVVRDRELSAVLKMAPEKRYGYFVKRVADWQTAWALWKDGWILLGTPNGEEHFPLWPAKEFAEACAGPLGFDGAVAEPIDLDRLRGELMNKLTKRGVGVAVFPDFAGSAASVDPVALDRDLEVELAKY
jgi:hypothetical protein